ncbi:MAG TPA: biopolymer transporter ExbD [Planctomycetaceae bacterium]|nr:biopolymer transporter ExbD [Planctomycetaceae bacterium]
MRSVFVHRDERPREQVPMTPMIDIVFLLLIFFVCASAGQIRESVLATELAAGGEASEELPDREPPLLGQLWLHLRREADERTIVEFNNPQYGQAFDDFDRLRGRLLELAAVAREMPVILEIAPDVPMGDMIRVYDICRQADFETIQFAAEMPGLPESRG